jgi:hypothetical protein
VYITRLESFLLFNLPTASPYSCKSEFFVLCQARDRVKQLILVWAIRRKISSSWGRGKATCRSQIGDRDIGVMHDGVGVIRAVARAIAFVLEGKRLSGGGGQITIFR